MQNSWRVLLAFVVSLTACMVLVVPALATDPPGDPPDSPPLMPSNTIFANRHLLETDDLLIYARYTIPYSGPFINTVDETFLFELIGTDGITQLATTTAYPYNGNGYNYGLVSFYFSQADAPTWNPVPATYTIRISENPVLFPAPVSWNFSISTSAWSTKTTQAANQAEAKQRIGLICRYLEQVWLPATALLEQQDTGTVLSAEGEAYLRNAIPGLQNMVPDLFYVQSNALGPNGRTWGTVQSAAYKVRLDTILIDGVPWLKNAVEYPAAALNIAPLLFVDILMVALCIFLIYKSMQWWGSPAPGYMASTLLVSFFGMFTMGLTVVGLVGFICIVLVAWVLFMKRA